jgi:transcriptional antiterminator NusG
MQMSTEPEPTTSDSSQVEDKGEAPAAAAPAEMRWYAVHTYSGYEGRVRDALRQRMQQFALEPEFGEILIPSETTTETTSTGKTRTRSKVRVPGYLFIQMKMNERTWHLVKETPRVIGFIGNQNPVEVPLSEIDTMRRGIVEGTVKPKPRLSFTVGEEVRVLDSAFANFTGTVDEVNAEKQKVKVIVSIFGRPTSVELDFSTVEKR